MIILFFIVLTTVLTFAVILLWENAMRRPFYEWVDARYPGVEYTERRRVIQQFTEHFFISVSVDGIVVTLLLGVVRRQRRKLSESEERYRMLFEHANDGIGVISVPDYKIVQVNHKFGAILGLAPSELVGRRMHEFIHSDNEPSSSDQLAPESGLLVKYAKAEQATAKVRHPSQSELDGMLAELFDSLDAFVAGSGSESSGQELTIRTPRGLAVPVSASFSILSTSEARFVILLLRDLSEQKRLEVEKAHMRLRLTHNEKIAALGRAAAQVAHEVKNPLAGLRLYSLHLKTKVAGKLSESEMDIVNKIADGIGRLTQTTEQILSFARPIKMTFDKTDLNRVVRDAVQLIEPQSTANKINVQLELAEHLAEGLFDHASMHAALMNLLLNGIQSMSGGGTLTVSTEMRDGAHVISITDTGKGMSEEQVRNVFEPFYTTRAQGLGLGLPYAKKIIEQHQGSIHVKSQEGVGTRIEIILPPRP